MAKKAAKKTGTKKRPAKRSTKRYLPKSKKRGKKRKGMADAFTHTRITNYAKNTVLAMAGGTFAAVGKKAMGGLQPLPRTGINLAVSFVLGEILGWANVNSGFVGATVAIELAEPIDKMLSEIGVGENATAKYADGNAANQLPIALNDGNQILNLMEDANGTYYYMNDNTGAMYLAQDIYPQYMPRY